MNKLVLLPALAVSVAGACLPAHAAEPASARAAAKADAPSKLTVVRDATTGELRAPTAEEAEALQGNAASKAGARTARATTASTAAAPLTRTHAGGATSVRLTDEMTSQVIAVRGADGAVHTHCFDDRSKARAALSMRAIATAGPKE